MKTIRIDVTNNPTEEERLFVVYPENQLYSVSVCKELDKVLESLVETIHYFRKSDNMYAGSAFYLSETTILPDKREYSTGEVFPKLVGEKYELMLNQGKIEAGPISEMREYTDMIVDDIREKVNSRIKITKI